MFNRNRHAFESLKRFRRFFSWKCLFYEKGDSQYMKISINIEKKTEPSFLEVG